MTKKKALAILGLATLAGAMIWAAPLALIEGILCAGALAIGTWTLLQLWKLQMAELAPALVDA